MKNEKRVVVVTGASAGVGRAIARRFAREGAKIGLVARGHAGLEAACREVEELGGEALILPCDVAEADQVEAAAARVEEELGPIDVWVNNAMTTVFARFDEITPAEYQRVTDVTYHGYVHGTRAALARMKRRNRGTIVQVGSALAYRGIPLQTAYCGAKHAIEGFTEALRCELLADGSDVWITMVQLPAVNTPQFQWGRSRMPRQAQPVPPIYQPEVPAEAVYFAASHRRREVIVGASTAVVIAGNKVAPGLGDRYLAATGVDSQMLDEPRDPLRPDNLFAPVDQQVDYGAHGTFDERAHGRSLQLWMTMHRTGLALAAAAAVALVVARRTGVLG